MRKPALCISENKGADQNCAAELRLCLCFIDSTILLLFFIRNFKSLAIVCGCTPQFVWDLVWNPKARFSRNMAHFKQSLRRYFSNSETKNITETDYMFKKSNLFFEKC